MSDEGRTAKVPIAEQVGALNWAIPIMEAHMLNSYHLYGMELGEIEDRKRKLHAALATLRWFEKNGDRVRAALVAQANE